MARLVDSSVLIGMERRRIDLRRLPEVAGRDDLALSAVSASELLVGLHRSDSSRREGREDFVARILDEFPVIPFELVAARTHARLSAELTTAGIGVGAHDLLIAATALAHGYAMVTDNIRDFRRVPGLVVVQPNW